MTRKNWKLQTRRAMNVTEKNLIERPTDSTRREAKLTSNGRKYDYVRIPVLSLFIYTMYGKSWIAKLNLNLT